MSRFSDLISFHAFFEIPLSLSCAGRGSGERRFYLIVCAFLEFGFCLLSETGYHMITTEMKQSDPLPIPSDTVYFQAGRNRFQRLEVLLCSSSAGERRPFWVR